MPCQSRDPEVGSAVHESVSDRLGRRIRGVCPACCHGGSHDGWHAREKMMGKVVEGVTAIGAFVAQ